MKHILMILFITFCAGCGKHDVLDEVIIDGAAPAVVAVTPANGGMDVAADSPMTVQFSEKISNASITLTEVQQGTVTSGNILVDGEKTLTFSTGMPILKDNSTYVVTLTSVEDLAGNQMAGDYSWIFRTADPTAGPMRIETVSPAPLEIGSPVNATISIFFSELPSPASLENSITLTGPEGSVAGNILYSASQRAAYFTPYFSLRPGATYTARVSGVKDVSGNVIPDTTWFFTTGTGRPL